MYQARYLAGIVAGMETTDGELGYVATFPIPEVIRGINAFALGARSVRPDAKVYVRYCHSWTEDELAADACTKLLDAHPIDIITMHTDSLMPHKIAESRGVKSIGCNKDNHDLFTSTYLTAGEWNWQVYYRRQIWDCLRGKFHGKHTWVGMEDGIVKLGAFSNQVRNETKVAVKAANFRLVSREMDVFYGPIRDNQGNMRVEAGEAMSDQALLTKFDWYVEGVSVEQ
jgi:basic membrane protein A